jgi:hypothetical protein
MVSPPSGFAALQAE